MTSSAVDMDTAAPLIGSVVQQPLIAASLMSSRVRNCVVVVATTASLPFVHCSIQMRIVDRSD